MARPLPYPVYDADNHLYESQDAMTAHLPRKWRNEFCYVDVGDHALMNAVLHSLNEWLHEAWGFHREERIFAVPFLTLMDVDMAVAELEWLLARGARTVGLRPAPVPGYRGSRSPGLPEFDPFWARVEEADRQRIMSDNLKALLAPV